jgi:hypothetical protein
LIRGRGVSAASFSSSSSGSNKGGLVEPGEQFAPAGAIQAHGASIEVDEQSAMRAFSAARSKDPALDDLHRDFNFGLSRGCAGRAGRRTVP